MIIHIGKKLEEVAKQQGMGATELGKKLNTTRENIYNIYLRETIDTPLLLLCCKILNHDFFQYFYEEEPLVGFRKQQELERQVIIDQLKDNLSKSDYLTDVQKELIETQRKNLQNLYLLLKEREKEIETLKSK